MSKEIINTKFKFSNSSKSPKNFMWVMVIFFSIFMLIAPMVTYFCNFNGALSNDQTIWGAFGDYFGGIVSPVFSFLSFIALVYTVYLQKVEIDFLKKEKNDEKHNQARKEQITELKSIIKLISIEIDNKWNRERTQNTKSYLSPNNFEKYPIFRDIRDRLITLKKYLIEIKSVNRKIKIVEFYCDKYREIVDLLGKNNHIDVETRKFYIGR